jgi:nucleotide-binding universal stress UspA family protein
VSWSFKVVRGDVAEELLAEAAEADLLALGRASRSRIQTIRRLGSTARKALVNAPRSLLVVRAGVDLDRPVHLVYDGSEGSQRALLVAAALAQSSGRLRILICAESVPSAQALEKDVRRRTEAYELALDFRHLLQPDPTTIVYVLRLSGVDLLIIGSSSQLPAESIHSMIDHLEHPVLVIR